MWLKQVLYSKIKIKKFVHVCDIELNRWPIIYCCKSKGSFISTKNENGKSMVHSIQYRGLIVIKIYIWRSDWAFFYNTSSSSWPSALLELELSRLRVMGGVGFGSSAKRELLFCNRLPLKFAHLIHWMFASGALHWAAIL